MKHNNYPFYKCVVVTLLFILAFAHCAKLSITSQCVEDGSGICQERQGHTSLLIRKSVDILIVLDNSPLGQKLNPQITSNLNQLVQCIEPLDWRVGIISGAEDKDSPLGELIRVERGHTTPLNNKLSPQKEKSSSSLNQRLMSREERELAEMEEERAKSNRHREEQDRLNTERGNLGLAKPAIPQKFITPDRVDHKKAFTNTVSLSSGCDKPPFCHKGKRKPLSALQAFMQNTADKDLFLRESTHLAVVVVSSSDEEGGFFSDPDISAQEVLSSISLDYSSDKWTAFSVTDAGKTDDCVSTAGDAVQKGVGFLATVGDIVGLITVDPLVMLGSAILSYHANKPRENTQGLSQFASGGGGQTFDICKPFFGKAVAYSVLKSVDRESQFPEPCQQFSKSHLPDLESEDHKKELDK